jgi:serine/threonine-protein kinase
MVMQIPLREGDRIADYVVERIVGVGGMAAVAVASHESARHRVAIKMLLPGNASQTEVVKRFEREQRTLMQLHSEHALRVYGAGRHGNLPFMLVEYLQGHDLSEVLKTEGPLPIEQAVEYILQACHCVAEAHSLGITHRDLKPGNLFLTRRTDGSPCIKVLDFGISKVQHDVTDEPTLTKTTAVMGSPFYMSPEQMLSSRDVDARTDIWALGVTLYELLTKSLPFAAETAMQVCRRIMGDAPTPLRKLRPHYPEKLERAIERCLQRRPDQRYANIADFAQQLVEFGPAHAAYAVQSIFELVEPSAPQAQSHLMDGRAVPGAEPGVSDEQTGTSTTLYLQADTKSRSGLRPVAAVALSLLTFALGAGLGWALALPTDPTRGAAASPGRAREDAPRGAPSDGRLTHAATPAPPAGDPDGDRTTGSRATPIDLDDVNGSEVGPGPAGAPKPPKPPGGPASAAATPTLGTPPTATAMPSARPASSGSPKPAATATAAAGSASAPRPPTPPPGPAASNVVF